MTELKIKYEHGEMNIEVEKLLQFGTKSQIRGILKEIRKSEHPDYVDVIKDHVAYAIKDTARQAGESFHKCDEYAEKVKQYEQALNNAMKFRDTFHNHKSESYMKANDEVQDLRRRLNGCKTQAREEQRHKNQLNRHTEFLKNVLDTLF